MDIDPIDAETRDALLTACALVERLPRRQPFTPDEVAELQALLVHSNLAGVMYGLVRLFRELAEVHPEDAQRVIREIRAAVG